MADGMLPKLGLKLQGILVEAKDPCVTRSRLNISELYVPVKVSSFFTRQLRFSNIQAGVIKFTQSPAVCNANEVAQSNKKDSFLKPPNPSPKKDEKESEKDIVGKLQDFFEHRLEKEIINSRQWFESLYIEQLVYSNEELKKDWVELSQFYFNVYDAEKELSVSTKVKILPKEGPENKASTYDLRINLAKEVIKTFVKGSYKEGDVDIKSAIQVASGDYSGVVKLNYIPLQEMILLWERLSEKDVKFDPKLMWLTCGGKVSGNVRKAQSLSLNIGECSLLGDAGRVKAANLKIEPLAEKEWSPIPIQVKKMSLKKVLSFFGETKMPNNFTKFGHFNGVLTVHKADSVTFSGGLENVEAIFSSSGSKRIQNFKKVNGEVSWHDGRISGIIDSIDIAGGHFTGEVSFNLVEDLSEGLFVVKVDALKLSAQVEKLLFRGILEPLQIYGQANIEDLKVKKWTGHFGSSSLVASGWSADTLKVKTQYLGENVFEADVKINQIKADQGSEIYNLLGPAFLEKKEFEFIELEKNYFKASLYRSYFEWKKLQSQAKNKKVIFASAGRWHFGKEIKGWLNVDLPKMKLLTWDVLGSSGYPQLVPTKEMLMKLAKSDLSLKVPESSEPKVRLQFLQKILKKDQFSRIKKIGEELVEKAKQVLPALESEKANP